MKHHIYLIFITALCLEALGVMSGSYAYGDFPFKLMGVPISIAGSWVLIGEIAYLVSVKRGLLIGTATPLVIDLILEPFAYYTGAWTWLNPMTQQIYYGSTTANIAVWLLMGYFAIQLQRRMRTPFLTPNTLARV